MRAALWLVGLFGVAVASALLAGSNHSTVTVFWAPYRVDVSLNLALALLTALFVVLHLALRALSALLDLPQQAKRWRLQQKERAMHAALLDAMVQLLTGRYVRSGKSAQKALDLEQALAQHHRFDDALPRHATQLRALAHLLAAESAQALSDQERRESHLQAVLGIAERHLGESVQDVVEATRLRAARWALRDRNAPLALEWLNGLRHGTARRTLTLRLRLKATRLDKQYLLALDTARLLAKHGAFSSTAAHSLVRELAVVTLNEAQDAAQLQRAWSSLDTQERDMSEVALHAAQRMLKFSGEAQAVMPWLTPLWNRMLQQPDSLTPVVRYRLVHLLAQTLTAMPKDSEWLTSIEGARLAYPRWAELQYLAGMVCWQHALWGKAQQMLEQAAEHLQYPEMQRQAWRTLALLAEHKEETARAQLCWKRAAEVVIG